MPAVESVEEAGQALGPRAGHAQVHEPLLARPGADLRHAARPDDHDVRVPPVEEVELVRRPGLLGDDLPRDVAGRRPAERGREDVGVVAVAEGVEPPVDVGDRRECDGEGGEEGDEAQVRT